MNDSKSMTAAEYVLGTLDISERRDFERQLASDALLRAQVSTWEAQLDPIAQAAEPIEPSAALLARLEAQIDEAESRKVVSMPVTRRPFYRRPAAAVLGLMAASLVGFAFVRQFDGLLESSPPPAQIAVPAPRSAQPPRTAEVAPCANDSKSTSLAAGQSTGDSSSVVSANSAAGTGALSTDNPASGRTANQQASRKDGPSLEIASASGERDRPARVAGGPGARDDCR